MIPNLNVNTTNYSLFSWYDVTDYDDLWKLLELEPILALSLIGVRSGVNSSRLNQRV